MLAGEFTTAGNKVSNVMSFKSHTAGSLERIIPVGMTPFVAPAAKVSLATPVIVPNNTGQPSALDLVSNILGNPLGSLGGIANIIGGGTSAIVGNNPISEFYTTVGGGFTAGGEGLVKGGETIMSGAGTIADALGSIPDAIGGAFDFLGKIPMYLLIGGGLLVGILLLTRK